MLIVMARLLWRTRSFYLNGPRPPAMIGHVIRTPALRARRRRRHALRARRILGNPVRAAAAVGVGVPSRPLAGRSRSERLHGRHDVLSDSGGTARRAVGR